MPLKSALIFFCAVVFTHTSQAQFRNIMLDEQAAGGTFVCEPAIAINPKDPKNIVAGSLLDNVYYTKDGGETWSKGKLISSLGFSGDPSLISDQKGNFYYFHLSGPADDTGVYERGKADRIVVQKSTDGGKTWSDGESIGLNSSKDQQKESATADVHGNVYLSWTQFDKYGDSNDDYHSNILFSMSKGGKKWTDPVVISGTPGDCLDGDGTTAGAMPVVTFDGKVFVAWAHQDKIYLDRSFNGGERWLMNDIEVAGQPGGWDLKIPGHDRCNGMPVLMTDKSKSPYRGSLYLLWADQRNGDGDTDIWFTRSLNFGDNWATPARVNDDGPGKHQYLPSMTVDPSTGYIYIIYYDRREYDDNQTDVYLAWSVDGGASFKNTKISEEPFVPQDDKFFGDYNSISAQDGVITPVWTRMDNGRTSIWTTVIKQEELAPRKGK